MQQRLPRAVQNQKKNVIWYSAKAIPSFIVATPMRMAIEMGDCLSSSKSALDVATMSVF
jgi:hypothetical protein